MIKAGPQIPSFTYAGVPDVELFDKVADLVTGVTYWNPAILAKIVTRPASRRRRSCSCSPATPPAPGALRHRRSQVADEGVGGTAVADLQGGSPSAHPERYRLASPLARLPTGIPVRCVHDRQEDLVPFDQSSAYVDAAVAADDDAVLDPTNVRWTDTITWICPRFQP